MSNIENTNGVPADGVPNPTFTTTEVPPAPSFNQQPTQQMQIPAASSQGHKTHNTIPMQLTSAKSPESFFSSVKKFFKLMIPLITGRAAQALKQCAEIPNIWITGILFTAFSIGIIVSNSMFSFSYMLYNKLTFSLIPQAFQYGFGKWFGTMVTFTIAGAIFIVLRALAVKLSAMIVGVTIDFKKSLNMVTLAYSWVSAAALSFCLLILLSFTFFTISMLVIVPAILMAEILTYIGMIKLGNYKTSPVVPFAFTIAFTYPLSFFLIGFVATGFLY